jgi:hypothetical protein
MVVTLMAIATGPAYAGTVYTHSATSGRFASHRLTLLGVGRHVTWVTSGGMTGTAPNSMVQRRLFRRNVSATGVLDIARHGRAHGRRFVFRLTGMRYDAARNGVSYRATQANGHAGVSAASSVLRSFGRATLSVRLRPSRGASAGGAPPVGSGDNDGNDCSTRFANLTDGEFYGPKAHGNPIQIESEQQWDTDNWDPNPPSDIIFPLSADVNFTSDGGFLRGCAQTTVWHFVPECFVDSGCGPAGTFTIGVEWDWGWAAPRFSCRSSNDQFKCIDAGGGAWKLVPVATVSTSTFAPDARRPLVTPARAAADRPRQP